MLSRGPHVWRMLTIFCAGGVQHQSPHNRSDKTRFIYTFHMIEGAPGYTYDEKNWSVSMQGSSGIAKLNLKRAP